MASIAQSIALICVLINAFQIDVTLAARPKKQVAITKIDYDVNQDLLKMVVILKNNTDSLPIVDLTADLLVDLEDNLYLNSVLSRRSSQKSDYIPMIKTHKMNLCELLKKTEREPVHKFLIDSLKKNGHMMLFDCPVKKGNYYLKDFTIDGADLPSFTLPGDYKVEFAILQKTGDVFVNIWRMSWYASITNV